MIRKSKARKGDPHTFSLCECGKEARSKRERERRGRERERERSPINKGSNHLLIVTLEFPFC